MSTLDELIAFGDGEHTEEGFNEEGFVLYDPDAGVDDDEDMLDPEPDPGSDDGDGWGEDGRP